MTRKPLMSVAMMIALASTAVVANASDRHHGRNGAGPERAQMLFDRFDQNSDGQITKDEVAAAAAADFAKSDTDGDGQLSAAEMTAAADVRREQRRQARMERLIKRRDTNGDGLLSPEEMASDGSSARMDRMFAHLDSDDDGIISTAELEKMQGKRRFRDHRGGSRHGHGRN